MALKVFVILHASSLPRTRDQHGQFGASMAKRAGATGLYWGTKEHHAVPLGMMDTCTSHDREGIYKKPLSQYAGLMSNVTFYLLSRFTVNSWVRQALELVE